MKKFHEALSILAALSFMISACRAAALSTQAEKQPAQKTASYEIVLGKPMTDDAVTDLSFNNSCSSTDHFQLCKELGMAWWVASDQIVKNVYLYAGGTDGFKRYRGELPFGLTFYDPMWRVQEKFSNLNADDNVPEAGLPDEASSPDHLHYWASYKRFGTTIIYNSPFADEDAYIYAILVSR